MPASSIRRIHKVYPMARSLGDLKGPTTGTIQLPKHLFWLPGDRTFDLSTNSGVRIVYEAVLSEGSLDELCQYLNGKVLQERWPELKLSQELVRQWEARFPSLDGNRFSCAS